MVLHCRRWVVDLFIGLFVLVADRAVKYIALSHLMPGVPSPVGSFGGVHLSWTLTYNEGAAWGAFEGAPKALFIFRVCFFCILLVMYMKGQMTGLQRTALAVIIAGASGNIIDTAIWGHVVDMIHCEFWGWDYPVFNIADMAICTGAIAILILSLFSHQQKDSSD